MPDEKDNSEKEVARLKLKVSALEQLLKVLEHTAKSAREQTRAAPRRAQALRRGYHVTVAADGVAVLAALKKQAYDLILMDVQMPEMDGFPATAAIRAKEASGATHIPIIAMTAHALKGDQERCIASGMDGDVAKPIRSADLFAAIEAAVGKFKSVTPEPALTTAMNS